MVEQADGCQQMHMLIQGNVIESENILTHSLLVFNHNMCKVNV